MDVKQVFAHQWKSKCTNCTSILIYRLISIWTQTIVLLPRYVPDRSKDTVIIYVTPLGSGIHWTFKLRSKFIISPVQQEYNWIPRPRSYVINQAANHSRLIELSKLQPCKAINSNHSQYRCTNIMKSSSFNCALFPLSVLQNRARVSPSSSLSRIFFSFAVHINV